MLKVAQHTADLEAAGRVGRAGEVRWGWAGCCGGRAKKLKVYSASNRELPKVLRGTAK